MPWSPAQHNLFHAAAHNPAVAKLHGMTQTKAASMASEGVKHDAKRTAMVKALRSKR